MDSILQQLNTVRCVGGSILISDDGLTMASFLRNDIDEESVAASASSLIERSRAVAEKMSQATPSLIHTQGQDGGIIILAAGQAFLVILTDPNANLALLQLEAGPFAQNIAQRLTL
ncbi:MAG: roadblock/LC7 domain-containing protein [Planctomycetes bacterium]|nr:roadblock/LC7 domain-containing protein [Planctomycetota bacterium]